MNKKAYVKDTEAIQRLADDMQSTYDGMEQLTRDIYSYLSRELENYKRQIQYIEQQNKKQSSQEEGGASGSSEELNEAKEAYEQCLKELERFQKVWLRTGEIASPMRQQRELLAAAKLRVRLILDALKEYLAIRCPRKSSSQAVSSGHGVRQSEARQMQQSMRTFTGWKADSRNRFLASNAPHDPSLRAKAASNRCPKCGRPNGHCACRLS